MRPSGYVELGWCREAAARNSKGEEVSADSPDAIAWCPLGGMDASQHDGTIEVPLPPGDVLSARGFPDLGLVRNGVVIFAELKEGKGQETYKSPKEVA